MNTCTTYLHYEVENEDHAKAITRELNNIDVIDQRVLELEFQKCNSTKNEIITFIYDRDTNDSDVILNILSNKPNIKIGYVCYNLENDEYYKYDPYNLTNVYTFTKYDISDITPESELYEHMSTNTDIDYEDLLWGQQSAPNFNSWVQQFGIEDPNLLEHGYEGIVEKELGLDGFYYFKEYDYMNVCAFLKRKD